MPNALEHQSHNAYDHIDAVQANCKRTKTGRQLAMAAEGCRNNGHAHEQVSHAADDNIL